MKKIIFLITGLIGSLGLFSLIFYKMVVISFLLSLLGGPSIYSLTVMDVYNPNNLELDFLNSKAIAYSYEHYAFQISTPKQYVLRSVIVSNESGEKVFNCFNPVQEQNKIDLETNEDNCFEMAELNSLVEIFAKTDYDVTQKIEEKFYGRELKLMDAVDATFVFSEGTVKVRYLFDYYALNSSLVVLTVFAPIISGLFALFILIVFAKIMIHWKPADKV